MADLVDPESPERAAFEEGYETGLEYATDPMGTEEAWHHSWAYKNLRKRGGDVEPGIAAPPLSGRAEPTLEDLFTLLLTSDLGPAAHALVLKLRNRVDDAQLTEEMARRTRNMKRDMQAAVAHHDFLQRAVATYTAQAQIMELEIEGLNEEIEALRQVAPQRVCVPGRVIRV